MLASLPVWLRTILAFSFIGAVLVYGQRLAALGSSKIAGR